MQIIPCVADNLCMPTPPCARWWLRIATFLAAALAAGSAGYWGLKLTSPALETSTSKLVVPSPSAPSPTVIARVLGGGQLSPAATSAVVMDSGASRFKITGVVAGKNDQGYALIAVDGKPARPFMVGSQVSDTLLLQSVNKAGAALAASLDGPIAFRLDLPKFEPL